MIETSEELIALLLGQGANEHGVCTAILHLYAELIGGDHVLSVSQLRRFRHTQARHACRWWLRRATQGRHTPEDEKQST